MKHSFIKLHVPKSYLVVCRNQRQANDLWGRLHKYWSKIMPNFHITASESPLMIECKCGGDTVRFVSVRSATYIDEHRGFRGKTVYGDDVDKFLDEKGEYRQMKAQEYYEKYFENVESFEDIAKNGSSMFQDMLNEFDEIKKQRKVKTFGGTVGIVRELNDKWNAVAGKVERKFSERVIKRNVIWNLLLSKVDENAYPRKPD